MEESWTSPDATAPAPGGQKRAFRGRRWLVAIAVVGALVVGVQLWSSTAYDSAAADAADARTDAAADSPDPTTAREHADAAVASATAMAGTTSPELLGDEQRGELTTASGAIIALLATADGPTAPAAEPAREKPLWPWELLAQASEIRQQTTALRDRTTRQQSAARALDDAASRLDETTADVLRDAVAAVPTIEKTFIDGDVDAVIALRRAANAVTQAKYDAVAGGATGFLALDEATTTLRTSAQARLAAKAGPLLDARTAIEAYARSLSGEVLLEFLWVEENEGYGAGDSGIGKTYWDAFPEGYTAHILLTNSIARYWPEERMRAVVAHEVGHALTAKCSDMFDDTDQDLLEDWATAWAMSQGHPAWEAGAHVYGMPSDEMQKAAASCR